MPEGPEVRKTVENLQKFVNKTLVKITINNGRYKTHGPFKNYLILVKNLPLKIIKIDCKGKFIYFIFENNYVLFNTMGMSGNWQTTNDKHNNVSLNFKDLKTILHFNDYRNFGTLMYQNKNELIIKLNSLGPDILMEYTKYEEFRINIEKKRNDSKIGVVLLDQKVVSGCGNYLRAEVLYHCKINPYNKIVELTEKDLINIWKKLTKIGWIFYDVDKGIKKKVFLKNDKLIQIYGLNDINKKNNNEIIYNHNFIIYNQNKDPLGNNIVREKLGTRTIHYVPNIQK